MKIQKLLWIGLALSIVACDKDAPSYQGLFVDAKMGSQLSFTGNKANFKVADGQELNSEVKDLKVEDLLAGTPGLYMASDSANKNLITLYWISPDLSSKQEDGGLRWYSSSVVMFQFDSGAKDKVNEIQALRCQDGNITIDTATKRWEIACPANAEAHDLIRK